MKTTKDNKSNPLSRWSQRYDHHKQRFAGWLGERFNQLSRKVQIIILVTCFLFATGMCTVMIVGGSQEKNISETEQIVPLKLPMEPQIKNSKESNKKDSLQQSKPIYQYKNNEHGKDGNKPQN